MEKLYATIETGANGEIYKNMEWRRKSIDETQVGDKVIIIWDINTMLSGVVISINHAK